MLGIDVDVHSGAAAPLCGEPVDHATHVHGENGLAGATLPALRRGVASDDAVGFLVAITREHPDAWIVATGPLTNVAIALQRDPALAERVAGHLDHGRRHLRQRHFGEPSSTSISTPRRPTSCCGAARAS